MRISRKQGFKICVKQYVPKKYLAVLTELIKAMKRTMITTGYLVMEEFVIILSLLHRQ